MSGGTPTAGGLMRQRHSQGYASSGDDLEDDACSRIRSQSPAFPVTRTWVEVLENVIWIAFAVLIIYLGDWHSNLIYILFHDGRIRRYGFRVELVIMLSFMQSCDLHVLLRFKLFVLVKFITLYCAFM